MRIENVFPNHLTSSASSNAGRQSSIDTSFQKLLEEAKIKQGISSSPEVQPQNSNSLSGDKISLHLEGFRTGHKILDKLEIYQKTLENSQNTLKHIEPIIQSLSEEVNHLKDIRDKLPYNDPLNTILLELGVLSTVEIMKFKSGRIR